MPFSWSHLRAEVSEERSVSIFRVKTIGELGTMLYRVLGVHVNSEIRLKFFHTWKH
jgi:hypothetical protein